MKSSVIYIIIPITAVLAIAWWLTGQDPGGSGAPQGDTHGETSQPRPAERIKAVQYSPAGAKMLAANTLPSGHLQEIGRLAKNHYQPLLESLPLEDSPELRSLLASMGARFQNSPDAPSFMQEMTGLGLQHDAMAGMDDQDPSPYEGMSVAEAKENFKTQSAELKAIIFGAFAYLDGKNASLLRSQGDHKEIVEEFYDRAMKSGERSASTWLISEMEARGTAP